MAIVRHIKTSDLYRYLGDNKFRNIRTGAEGVVDPDVAKKNFRINVEATILFEENPIIEEMITALNLKFDISEWTMCDK